MKTEEIKPGDILFDKEQKLLVKVARVDEDGVVKYSAYTDMRRTFLTSSYCLGTRTADAYIPATDQQRKYLERNLVECKYVNQPKNNRMEALVYIIADLKAENMMMTERVHQLVNDYNDVVHQLKGMEKHEPNAEGYTLGELTEALEKCESLEKDNKILKQQCVQLQMERTEAKNRADDCAHQNKELFKQIARFDKSEFKEIGTACTSRSFTSKDSPVKVGSTVCVTCRHFLKMDKSFYVLCACRYDNAKDMEAQEHKNAND